jgi:hypothetical protein
MFRTKDSHRQARILDVLQDFTAPHPRREKSSQSQMWERQIQFFLDCYFVYLVASRRVWKMADVTHIKVELRQSPIQIEQSDEHYQSGSNQGTCQDLTPASAYWEQSSEIWWLNLIWVQRVLNLNIKVDGRIQHTKCHVRIIDAWHLHPVRSFFCSRRS